MNNIIDALKWRYATKVFDASKKISTEDWSQIEDALVLTASSFGLQPWKFIIVKNQEMRVKLKEASWNQSQVVEASHYVIFCNRYEMPESYVEKFVQHVSSVRGLEVSALSGYKNMMLNFISHFDLKDVSHWTAKQAYIALGNIMSVAAMLKIDTCAIEGLDANKYDEILALQGSGYKTAFACAFGYRSAEDKYAALKKVRFEKSDVVSEIN